MYYRLCTMWIAHFNSHFEPSLGVLAYADEKVARIVITRSIKCYLTIFKGTFDDLHFPVKIIKFSCRNRQIVFKKNRKIVGKISNFFRQVSCFFKEICQFIQENLTVFIGKCKPTKLLKVQIFEVERTWRRYWW